MSITNSSPDGKVRQVLDVNSITKAIAVTHEINLDAGKNARRGPINTYAPGNAEYDNKCVAYGLNPDDNFLITEFNFDEYNDSNVRAPFKMTQNDQLNHLPYKVVTQLNRTQGGAVSATSGEALAG